MLLQFFSDLLQNSLHSNQTFTKWYIFSKKFQPNTTCETKTKQFFVAKVLYYMVFFCKNHGYEMYYNIF